MKYIVNQDWLHQHLHDPKVVIIDCRFTLGQPHSGRVAYEQEHIPGAFYLDLEQDLSSPIQQHGGRHPLPDFHELTAKLGRIGIDEETQVITYDDQGGAMAARCWWLLTYLGHPDVSVLNGSFQSWKKAGYPVIDEISTPAPRTFTPALQTHMLASMEKVREKIQQQGGCLIDSREKKRYLGEEEPIDRVAGHIPSAIHSFWKEVLDEEGNWKSSEELQKHFAHLSPGEEIVVYCGSGVTATPNVLALLEAGFTDVKLYAGSWSDWISYAQNPIATGEE